MKEKKMTKTVLEQKARAVVNLARKGYYSLIQSMLEADFPQELAEFMLEQVEFPKTTISLQNLEAQMDWSEELRLPCKVENAKWFSKIAKENPRKSAGGADETRAVILALALVALTGKTSRFRVAAAKIKCAGFGAFGEKCQLPFEPSQICALIHILNRALTAVPNLTRLNISTECGSGDFSIGLLWIPQHIRVLRIACNQPILLADIRYPSSMQALEISAPRVFLDDRKLNGDDLRKTELRINPRRLEFLDSGIAECLLGENGDLNFERLQELDPKDAQVLAKFSGEINFNLLQLNEFLLRELHEHRSFKPVDRNLIWRFVASHEHYESVHLADDKFLVRGPYILEFSSGQSLGLTRNEDKPVELEVGQGFICTLDSSNHRTCEVTCRRVEDLDLLWRRVVKRASQIIIRGDLIVLKDNATLSKLSLFDGRTLGDLSLERTAGGSLDDSDFKMSHHIADHRLFLWSAKQKYQGGKWLVAVNLDRWFVEWSVDFPGITGRGMAIDNQGRIVFAVHDKVLHLNQATGETIGKPAHLNGSWPVVYKCYSDGSFIAGCQKGYDTPEMKCFNALSEHVWSVPLGDQNDNVTALDAAFFKDLILIPFPSYGDNRSAIWIIDRRTGKVIQTIKQKCFDIGRWRGIACFNDRQIMLIGNQGSALFDGIPSSWI